jgi:hypothetical protein
VYLNSKYIRRHWYREQAESSPWEVPIDVPHPSLVKDT